MRRLAAHRAGIRFNFEYVESGSAESREIRVDHGLISLHERGFVGVERIRVFHDEFASPHQTEPGTDFVAEFHLNLVQVQRQLPIAVDFAGDQIGDRLFMRAAQDHVVQVTVLEAHLLFADRQVPSRLLPQLGRTEDRHRDFERARLVHFFADDLRELFDHTLHERQIDIDAGGELADIAAAQQELMGDQFGFGLILSQGRDVRLAPAH